jgi:hypothetical protein
MFDVEAQRAKFEALKQQPTQGVYQFNEGFNHEQQAV